jgi:tight adherence protein B
MIYLILSLIIGVSTATIIWVIFVIEKNLSPNTLRRLEKIKRKSNVNVSKDNKLDLTMPDFEYKFKALGLILTKYKIIQEIKEMIKLADVKMHIDTFLILSFICAFPFLFFLLTPFKLMSLFSIGTFFIPTMYLKHCINQRFLDFSRQFPDALNLMASSLRAGHPLFAAIDMVTEEMPKPISAVFETTKKDISLGIDIKDAFYSMTKAMPLSLDLKFFITAVLIQKEVGGNLAELLDSLSGTIRERFKLMGQLRVQTAQTRLSGIIIGIVPLMVLLVIFFMSPDYVKPLFDTKDGQMAFCISIVLIVAGFISIKKISNIEI